MVDQALNVLFNGTPGRFLEFMNSNRVVEGYEAFLPKTPYVHSNPDIALLAAREYGLDKCIVAGYLPNVQLDPETVDNPTVIMNDLGIVDLQGFKISGNDSMLTRVRALNSVIYNGRLFIGGCPVITNVTAGDEFDKPIAVYHGPTLSTLEAIRIDDDTAWYSREDGGKERFRISEYYEYARSCRS